MSLLKKTYLCTFPNSARFCCYGLSSF